MFEIIFYKNLGESNRLDKTPYLTELGRVYGTLREECSIINPIITIDMTTYDVITAEDHFDVTADGEDVCMGVNFTGANYCYIPSFNRYYFIDDIISVNNNLWQFNMRCDVLMSYKEPLMNLDVFVDRQEYAVNEELPDNKMPVNGQPIISKIDIESGSSDLVDLLNAQVTSSQTFLPYVLSVAGTTYNPSDVIPLPDAVTTNLGYGTTLIYGLNSYHILGLSYSLMNTTIFTDLSKFFNDDPANAIMSIRLYSFDVRRAVYNFSRNVPQNNDDYLLYFGKYNSSDSVFKIPKSLSSATPVQYLPKQTYIRCGTIIFPRHFNNFLDYNPYTTMSLYLPFIGYVEINSSLYCGKTINIDCYVDFYSGDGLYVLKDISTNETIQTFKAKMSSEITINTTNSIEASRNLLLSALSIGVSGVTGRLNRAASDVYAPPKYTSKRKIPSTAYTKYKESKDISEFSQKIKNQYSLTTDLINGQMLDIDRGQQNGDLLSMIYFKQPFVLVTRPNPVYFSIPNYTSKYRKLVGSPSSYNGSLGLLYGYTECCGFHLENIPNATSSELEELDGILRDGILMPDNPNI